MRLKSTVLYYKYVINFLAFRVHDIGQDNKLNTFRTKTYKVLQTEIIEFIV